MPAVYYAKASSLPSWASSGRNVRQPPLRLKCDSKNSRESTHHYVTYCPQTRWVHHPRQPAEAEEDQGHDRIRFPQGSPRDLCVSREPSTVGIIPAAGAPRPQRLGRDGGRWRGTQAHPETASGVGARLNTGSTTRTGYSSRWTRAQNPPYLGIHKIPEGNQGP